MLKYDVLTLNKSQPVQTFDERLMQVPDSLSSACREDANSVKLADLLRARGDSPSGYCAAEKSDECAPSHVILLLAGMVRLQGLDQIRRLLKEEACHLSGSAALR
jgi:hypothetical protein